MQTTKLEKINACREAKEWVATQRNHKEAWQNCERGDWMLWLAKKLKVDDRKLALAKFKCANQVRHLMKDSRSIAALDAAERYGNGEIGRDELYAYAAYAADAADAAYAAAYADAADAAAYAAHAAAYADAAADAATYAAHAAYAAAYADAAADAAYAAAYADAADAAAYAAAYAAHAAYAAAYAAAAYAAYAADAADARKESLKTSADFCREILPEEVLTAYAKPR